VQVDKACAPSLRTAVAAHPALQAAPATARLHVACSAGPHAGPTLRWLADSLPMSAEGALQWAAGVAPSRRPALDASRLRITAELAPRAGDAVLLAAGGQPVLVLRGGGVPQAEVALDADALGADLPLLLDFAAEQLFGRPLLDPVAALDRGPTAARVLPAAAAASQAQAVAPAAESRTLTRPVLALALALLLWEVVALGLRWSGLRRHEREVTV